MKIAKPVVREFSLETGEDGNETVTIRQATFAATRKRSELFAKRRSIFSDDNMGEYAVEQEWNSADIMVRDIYQTLSGVTNIVDEDGNEFFKFKDRDGVQQLAMTETEFEKKLGMLPDEMVKEIYKYVLEVNPQWDASRSGE